MHAIHKILKCLAAACTALAALASVPAHAQKAGDNVVSAGWFNIQTSGHSDPLTTTVAQVPINYPLGLPSTFSAPGSSLSTSNANTVGFTFSHFFTDHIALTAVGGLPPEFKIYGHGELIPPGPAGALGRQSLGDPALNPIITKARQWSPAAMVQYHFLEPTSSFRPFVGVGLSYNFFTNIEVNPAFANSLNSNLGASLPQARASRGRRRYMPMRRRHGRRCSTSGAPYNFNEHWGADGVGHVYPAVSTSTMTVKASDGTVLSTSKTKLEPNPIVFYLAASYKF